MNNISNRALISRLYSSADHQLLNANYDIESWSAWYDIVQDLTGPEKMVYVIVKLNQAVTGGGFTEFYNTSLGVFSPEIIHALNEIKADKTAEIITKSLGIVNPKGLLDDAYKSFVFNLKVSEQQRQQLYALDIQYDQLEGHENLEDLLGDYLQKVVKDFI